MYTLYLLALLGLGLSVYSWYVDYRVDNDKTYKASCDINDRMSCTKASKSPYGKTFGISNSFLGMLYYIVIFVLALRGNTVYLLAATSAGLIMSFYFAYLLYFKVKSFCIICNSVYLVNILLFIFTLI